MRALTATLLVPILGGLLTIGLRVWSQRRGVTLRRNCASQWNEAAAAFRGVEEAHHGNAPLGPLDDRPDDRQQRAAEHERRLYSFLVDRGLRDLAEAWVWATRVGADPLRWYSRAWDFVMPLAERWERITASLMLAGGAILFLHLREPATLTIDARLAVVHAALAIATAFVARLLNHEHLLGVTAALTRSLSRVDDEERAFDLFVSARLTSVLGPPIALIATVSFWSSLVYVISATTFTVSGHLGWDLLSHPLPKGSVESLAVGGALVAAALTGWLVKAVREP